MSVKRDVTSISMIAKLLNPYTLIAGVVIAFALFIFVIMDQNGDMKVKLDAQEQTISQLQDDAKLLKAGQEILINDISRLDEIANYKQTIVIREQNLDNDLEAIPETEDRPFSDPNNLAYAQRLRDHQNATLSELATDQP